MEKTNTQKIASKLTAKEVFVIDSMVKKINEDWDVFIKEAQQEISNQYAHLQKLAAERSSEVWFQQTADEIVSLKRSVSEERKIKQARFADLDKIELLLESKN